MKVLIYGLGRATDFVVGRICKEHNIIGYTDSCARISVFNGKPFYVLKDIVDEEWDYIVITICDRKVAWDICTMLINEYGIDRRKIIPYFVYADSEKFGIRIEESKERYIEGLIFGNSHALYGFLVDYLPLHSVNLSCQSQDIYYNYVVFRRILEKYSTILSKVRIIIIDLYDYNVFNVDTSRGRNVLDFISLGGCIDKHNFELNDNYEETFEESVFREKYLLINKEKTKEIMEKLFGRQGVCEDKRIENSRWDCIKNTELLDSNVLESKNLSVRHEDTISENICILEKFIKEIKTYNSNIKIIFTLIPRFQSMEVAMRPKVEVWKKEFFEVVNMFIKKYNVIFKNYKECEEIYSNNRFYYDACHLNTQGGKCLTSILARDIENLIN